jgi:hypothetical protein
MLSLDRTPSAVGGYLNTEIIPTLYKNRKETPEEEWIFRALTNRYAEGEGNR